MRLVTEEDTRYERIRQRGNLKTDERIRRMVTRNRRRRELWTVAALVVWALVIGMLLGMMVGIAMMTGGV